MEGDKRVVKILLQKSPRRSCRIKIRNNRIGANGFLNQRCALTPILNQSYALRRAKYFCNKICQSRPNAPQQKAPLFDQFVVVSSDGGEAPACSGIGVVVQRFAIGPGVMVTRSTSATVG